MEFGWTFLIGSVWCHISFPRSLLSTPCWSFRERRWWVVLHALRKGGGIAIAFVLVCLLSRCCVARAAHLLQHGGIRQGIFCFCGCLEALSRWQLAAWRLVLIGCIRTPVESRCSELLRVDVCGHFDTTLVSNTHLGQRQVLLLMFEVHQSVLPILYQPIVEVNCTGRWLSSRAEIDVSYRSGTYRV